MDGMVSKLHRLRRWLVIPPCINGGGGKLIYTPVIILNQCLRGMLIQLSPVKLCFLCHTGSSTTHGQRTKSIKEPSCSYRYHRSPSTSSMDSAQSSSLMTTLRPMRSFHRPSGSRLISFRSITNSGSVGASLLSLDLHTLETACDQLLF